MTNIDNNLKGTSKRGVKECPYFDIPIEQAVWPLLHALIGIGNQLLQLIVDLGETEMQCLP
jgi:hypothetical protein